MARRDNVNPHTRHVRPKWQFPADWAEFIDLFDQRIVKILGYESEDKTLGPDVIMYILYKTAYKSQMAINLTRLTEPELDALKNILDSTIELARPIVQLRDKVARDNLDHGEDSDPRVYRPVPNIIKRPWAVGIDAASVLDRSEDLPTRPRSVVPRNQGLGSKGGPVAEPDARDSQAEDNATETN